MLRGLYAITATPAGAPDTLAQQAAAAIRGGARIVQYRDKGTDSDRRRHEAGALARLCRTHAVPLIVNDDVELALAVGAAGVHLGRDDADPVAARDRLPAGSLIGVSCYDRLDRARVARQAGADYVAFGSFFPSATKPDAVRAGIAVLQQARRELDIPIVAIGGITPENGRALVDAGADMLAVIQGVFGAVDVEAAARAYRRLFEPPDPEPHA